MTAGVLTIPKQRSMPTLFAPAIDMIVAGGGLSIIILLFLVLNHYSASPPWLIWVVFWSGIVVNNSHYAATYHRVYRSVTEIKKYAWAAVAAPIGLILLGAACILNPLTIAPWYCKAYVIGSGFHYSGQSYGIALIYARKAGIKMEALQKLCILVPIFMSYFYGTIYHEASGATKTTFFSVSMPVIGISTFAILPAMLLLAAGIEGYILLNVYLWWKHKKLMPFIVHLVAVSHATWFLVWTYQSYTEMIPFFHCFQYLLITSYFYMQELVKRGAYTATSAAGYLKSKPFLKYYLTLMALGYALFFIVPKLMTWAGICTYALANAIVFSFLNLHHFVLDGEIWKLRKPEIGKPLTE